MTSNSANKARLIAEIYEVVLKPERYDHFMALWERHISGEIGELETIKGEASSINKYINDPELEAHFQRAYEILEKLGREGSGIASVSEFTAKKTEATFFIDVDGEIIHENKSARKLLGNITAFKGLSSFIDAKDHERLHTMILRLNRPNIMEQLHIFHFNLDKNESTKKNKQQLFFARTMQFSHSQPVLLCIYELGVNWDEGLEVMLKEAFEFSSRELLVARGLCEGKTLERIATERERSIHTVRAQVKSMLRKTGTASQSDLVRVMVALASFGRTQTIKSANTLKRLEFGEQFMISVEGDRKMPVYQIGAQNGRPVLFIHGILDGIAISKSVSKLLVKNNIRLIAPVRPSFSNSPSAYTIKTAPDEFALDLRYVMDHLEIEKTPIIGHMAGSVYAFAAASILPDRISSILNVSGGVPIKSLSQLSSMSNRQRAVAWTARFMPNLLPVILRAGISQIDRGDEDKFMNALYAEGSKDRDVVTNVDIRTAIHAGYKFAVAQGHRAFEVDSRHITRDWSSYLADVRQQVIFAHGVFDPTVAIKSVREFTSQYDNIKLIEHKDAGQLLFYQKPKAIISTLCKMLEE